MPSHTAKERAKKSRARSRVVRKAKPKVRALPAKANKRAVVARKKSSAAKVVARRARNRRRGR